MVILMGLAEGNYGNGVNTYWIDQLWWGLYEVNTYLII